MTDTLTTTLCFTTAALLAVSTSALAAPPFAIDSVDNQIDSWAQATDFPLDLNDVDSQVDGLLWFATNGLDTTAWADANSAWGTAHAHCFAVENLDGFQIFGDSSSAINVGPEQWAKGTGSATTAVNFSLTAPTKVCGQFCVRGDDAGGDAAAIAGLFPLNAPDELYVFITLEDGDDCRDFEIVLPSGQYTVRAYCDSLADADIAIEPDNSSWSQFGIELLFKELPSPDISGDGVVDGVDLARFLAQWGSNNPDFDFNGDGIVDGQDLAILLAAWT